jgi:P-type Cu+ transporter
MPTDPVCGMFVEESPDSLQATVRGVTYYFCSESCLREFTRPEIELKHIKYALVLSLALGIPILILTYVPLPTSLPLGWILLILATPVQFIAGSRFYRGTYDAIKMRSTNMDVLICIGTSAAYFYSALYVLFPKQFPFGGLYFDTSAIIIALILIGRLLEYSVRGRATEAVRKLLELQPRMATVVRGGAEEIIPVEQILEGDIIVVKPGEKIPADGLVIDGHSLVDEKMISGESIPVEKTKDSQVIGGTINQNGSLKIRALKVGPDTTLAKIVKVVQEAQSSKGPLERLVDNVSRYFVPMVVAIALLSFLAWTLDHKPISFGFTTAIAVLIIACPCALGLATPAAVVVGAGKGAENGILIRGGDVLEKIQKIDTIVFDKTGTLTTGKPVVTDLVNLDPSRNKDQEILKLAAIAEKRSQHPLAAAILSKVDLKNLPDPEKFDSVPGEGIYATYAGMDILFGNAKMLDDYGVPLEEQVRTKVEELGAQGKTAVLLVIGKRVAGIIAVSDTVKEHALEAVNAFKKMGLEVMMLTGDSEQSARSVAKKLGIEKYFAEVSPTEKFKIIKDLQKENRKVAFVGDGINDAPALAQADVGIAIGSGSDIAIEAGGLILMKDDLRDVVAAIQLSKSTMKKIKENLFWAFIYNIALIPLAAGLFFIIFGVLLNPIYSGAAMALSSVTVVSNSLTLREFKPKY